VTNSVPERPSGDQDPQLAAVRAASDRALAHAQSYETVLTLEEARYATGVARRLGRLEESAKALAAAGMAHYYQADLVEAVIRALDAVRRSGNEADLSRAWFVTTIAFLAVGAHDVATIASRRALEHAEKAGDEGLLVRAHSCAGFVATEQGRHEEAVMGLYTATRLAQKQADRTLYMKTLCNLARVLRDGGDAQAKAGDKAAGRESWRHAARLFSLALHLPAPQCDVIIAKGLLGQTRLRLGSAPLALRLHEEAATLLGPDTVPWVAAETLICLAQAQMAVGRHEQAARTLDRAATICKEPGAARLREQCHLLHAELASQIGRGDKVGVFQAYARTAGHHHANEMEAARRQALTLWQRFEAAAATPAT
jgi:tetratricopeptide (TPR) repeat protein